MSKPKVFQLSEDAIRILLIILGSVLSCLVLVFATLAIINMQNKDLASASVFLFNIFIVLGLSRLVTWLKERTKINFFRFLVLLIFDIGLGIIIVVAKDNPSLYQICGFLYCLSIVVSRVFKILSKPTVRNIVWNGIIAAFAVFLGIGLIIPEAGKTETIVLIICVIVAISAFAEVISASTSKLKIKVLFQIILKTYALEIIMGLITVMVAFSLILMFYEEDIPTFGDGLWYSFAVVTTIGFGDIAAKTLIGRIITVLLGLYGIVVVAVITSIIVNFYTEVSSKHDKESIKEIKQEAKKERK